MWFFTSSWTLDTMDAECDTVIILLNTQNTNTVTTAHYYSYEALMFVFFFTFGHYWCVLDIYQLICLEKSKPFPFTLIYNTCLVVKVKLIKLNLTSNLLKSTMHGHYAANKSARYFRSCSHYETPLIFAHDEIILNIQILDFLTWLIHQFTESSFTSSVLYLISQPQTGQQSAAVNWTPPIPQWPCQYLTVSQQCELKYEKSVTVNVG